MEDREVSLSVRSVLGGPKGAIMCRRKICKNSESVFDFAGMTTLKSEYSSTNIYAYLYVSCSGRPPAMSKAQDSRGFVGVFVMPMGLGGVVGVVVTWHVRHVFRVSRIIVFIFG